MVLQINKLFLLCNKYNVLNLIRNIHKYSKSRSLVLAGVD